MTDKPILIPVERIERAIHEIRGRKVVLDVSLATLYGVSTKRLKEQVRRNQARFSDDFMFRLTWNETDMLKSQLRNSGADSSLRSQNATLKRGQHLKYLPFAFTEHGAVMAATILKTRRAVEVSVFVVRAFVKMRQMLASHRELAVKLAELESHVATHDKHIQALFAAIRQLTTTAATKRAIGFQPAPAGGTKSRLRK